jgi:3-phenylpropionate/trans-cinnamate dioxygenase ferredoxin subunit
MARHVIGPAAEIAPGERRVVEVDGKKIVLFNLDGEFFALSDRCPHQGGSLSQGKSIALIQSPCPGEYSYSRSGEFVRCPWHAWEFDIRTGKSQFDPRRMKVRTFPACVEKGEALELQAETFPVSIEQDYVVVEV